MPTINDYKKKALNDAGYSGDISTAEWKWLKDICYPYVGAIPDMWRYALRQMGFSGSLIEAQSAMLKGLGYTDFSMNNKWYKYWRDTPLEGTTWWELGSVLDLDFANSRGFNSADRDKTTPDSILTYTSPSPKMVYGDDGVLRYANHNIFLYSQEFDNADWTKTRTTISANSVAAPDGTLTADTFVEDGTAAATHFITSSSITHTLNIQYRISVYAKKANRDWLCIQLPTAPYPGTNTNLNAYFDLATGVVGARGSSYTTSSIEDVGNGWYRCTVETDPTDAAAAGSIILTTSVDGTTITFDGASQASIYLWGAQYQPLPCHSNTYLPTTSAAAYSLPIDHDPTSFDPLGVLIEEQRTNLTIYSGDYSNAAWSGTATSKTSGQIDVLGGTGAGLVTADGSSALHTSFNGSSVNYTSGTTYAFSRFVKAGTQSLLQLIPPTTAFGATAYANFDLSGAGVTQSAGLVASGIEALTGGWYRVWVSVMATASVSASSGSLAFISTTTDARGPVNTLTTNFYDFGGQVEAGAFPTSYIPTVASQVTRAADFVHISSSTFDASATAGTILTEYNYLGSALLAPSARAPAYIGDGTNTHRAILLNGSGGLVRGFIGALGTQFDQSIGSNQGEAFFKAAIAFEANNANVVSEGVAGTVDTVVTVPSNLNSLRVGCAANAIGQISGHIKRLTYYKTRKSDAELVVLTA